MEEQIKRRTFKEKLVLGVKILGFSCVVISSAYIWYNIYQFIEFPAISDYKEVVRATPIKKIEDADKSIPGNYRTENSDVIVSGDKSVKVFDTQGTIQDNGIRSSDNISTYLMYLKRDPSVTSIRSLSGGTFIITSKDFSINFIQKNNNKRFEMYVTGNKNSLESVADICVKLILLNSSQETDINLLNSSIGEIKKQIGYGNYKNVLIDGKRTSVVEILVGADNVSIFKMTIK